MRFCDFLAFTLTINLSIETQFPSISQCSNDTVSDVASRLFKIAADDYNTDIRASSPELQLAHTVHTFATETNGNLYRPEFQGINLYVYTRPTILSYIIPSQLYYIKMIISSSVHCHGQTLLINGSLKVH